MPTPLASSRRAYDPLKDFEPIALLTVTAMTTAVHPSVPATTLGELVAHIKANPGKLSYGTAGAGSFNHLTGEMLKSLTGITGHLAGKLRILAVSSPNRISALPDVPAAQI